MFKPPSDSFCFFIAIRFEIIFVAYIFSFDGFQFEDDGVYWRLNAERFDQYFLDQVT